MYECPLNIPGSCSRFLQPFYLKEFSFNAEPILLLTFTILKPDYFLHTSKRQKFHSEFKTVRTQLKCPWLCATVCSIKLHCKLPIFPFANFSFSPFKLYSSTNPHTAFEKPKGCKFSRQLTALKEIKEMEFNKRPWHQTKPQNFDTATLEISIVKKKQRPSWALQEQINEFIRLRISIKCPSKNVIITITFCNMQDQNKTSLQQYLCGIIETSTNQNGWMNYINSTLLRHLYIHTLCVVSNSAQWNKRAGEKLTVSYIKV